jgi:hypothetical protein
LIKLKTVHITFIEAKCNSTMTITENETAMSRGRIPTYMHRSLIDFVVVLLRSDARC